MEIKNDREKSRTSINKQPLNKHQKRRQSLMGLKSNIYKILRILNDVNAVRKGRVKQRMGRRVSGKITGRLLRKLFK